MFTVQNKGVIYFNSGVKCLVRLIVSIHSLRQHYDGPITVISTGERSNKFFRELLKGANPFDINVVEAEFPEIPCGKNTPLLQKSSINRFTPYSLSIFLDSDTIICGDIRELWDLAAQHEIVVPQFADWTTSKQTIQKRIKNWRAVHPELIKSALNFGPAINCGVFAFKKDTQFITEWTSQIVLGQDCFIPDETGMQVILHQYPHFIADQKFNVSCKYSDPRAADTRVIHYHGRKHCRLDSNGKLLYNADIWVDHFNKVCEQNLFDIKSWLPNHDRTLRRYLRDIKSGNSLPQVIEDKRMTLVTAVNAPYLEKFKLTLPTWQMKPQFADLPLVVLYHGISEADLAFVHEYRDQVELVSWDMEEYESPRELMLSAFVLGAPKVVKTPYWVKLDVDTFFSNADDVFSEDMFQYDIAGHGWKYTKPGKWIVELDDWAESIDLAGDVYLDNEKRDEAIRQRGFGHRRLISWICLHKRDFTEEAAEYAGTRLPVPSHDTYLWYMAQRLPDRKWCQHNLKKRGICTHTNIKALRERIDEVMRLRSLDKFS